MEQKLLNLKCYLFQRMDSFNCFIPPQIASVLGATRLLALTKPSGGILPIVVGETFYQLTSHVLCLQFYDAFATHFSLH
jgi:hypothetical protein